MFEYDCAEDIRMPRKKETKKKTGKKESHQCEFC